MSRRIKRKLNRAAYPGNPGGATMYISPGQLQSLFAQTFYGSKAGIPVQDATMFSPGQPLPTQPGVNKGGLPNQFKFPISYNTYNPDRSLGKPDIPSFQQLRHVAMLYSGVTLCERAWFDMVPRMQLKINLHPDYVAQGYEEKDFQQEISYFRKWFEKPDGRRDIHTWLRMALREQTQIDELYLYKHRTKGGKLLGLHVVAGDTMKPLLNDWGDIPLPDDPEPYAYQQYPWGIPGAMYTTDMMIHYQESPAADTPYGQSRVERIIMEVNQALRKKRRDLAMFTEGNIPQGLMEVPEAPQWTPDIIDAYEQSWNALIAGNPQQQVRVKFTQPGMKYVKTDSGEIMTDFDLFLLNIATGCYGMSLQDLSFTGDIHKSAGDSQQNVLYRRTIGPLAMVYGMILTDIMHTDFEPKYKGDMFIATFGGFEEAEDLGAMAAAYSALTSAGILGLTNAGKLMKLPEDPDAPHIGRILITKDGPIFLDDMASDKMRNAAMQAKMAGYAMATNPPEPAQNNKGDTSNATSKQSSGSNTGNSKTRDDTSSAGSARDTDTSRSTPVRNERALCAASERDGRHPHRVQDSETRDGLHPAQPAHAIHRVAPGEEFADASGTLERHLPGKHDQKEHGIWASHKHGGTHMQKFADGLQKKAASYSAMADRKVSAHWTAQDGRIASQIAHDLRHIASVLNADPHANVAAMLKQMLDEAQKLHEMAPHAMSEHRLEVLQHTSEQYQRASTGGSHTAHSSHTGHSHHAHRTVESDRPQVLQQHTGIMIAFMLDQATAEKLVLPDGEPVENLHVTLAFMGDMNDEPQAGKLHPVKTLSSLQTVLSALTSFEAPLQGHVGGLGRFINPDTDVTPVIAQVNVPGLQEWRRRLVGLLEISGYFIAKDFDYLPHITLAYIPADAPMPVESVEPLPLTFDTLCLAVGDDRYYYPMGAGYVTRAPQSTETKERTDRTVGDETRPDASREAQQDVVPYATAGLYPDSGQADAARADYKRWRTRAIEDAKTGKAQRGFTSTLIPVAIHDYISQLLRACTTPDEVRTVFSRAQVQESEIAGSDQHLVYNEHFQVWEPHDTEQRLEHMRAQGVQYLEWETHISNSGVCPMCDQNVGQVVELGTPFKSGHRLPSCHPGCQCGVKRLMEKPLERSGEPVSYISKRGSCDCEECRAMDGKPIGEKPPPYHEGCDCKVTEKE